MKDTERITIDELAQQFGLHESYDADDIPDEIAEAMWYIAQNTGLLGDYNDGIVSLCEGGTKIQWYARSRNYFSQHDRLLHWIQHPDQSRIIIGTAGCRTHPETEETVPYAEIHRTDVWGGDEEWGIDDE